MATPVDPAATPFVDVDKKSIQEVRREEKQPLVAHQPQTLNDTAILGTVVSEYELPPAGVCWHCQRDDRQDDLFKPCHCNSFIHRDCFKKWRAGWINPRNYFKCPNCEHQYKMERVKENTATKQEIIRRYRFSVIKLWLGMLLFFGTLIGTIATIAYFADRSEKNVPVVIKYCLTSVVSGFPSGNSTAEWRENFEKPNVHVWPYYSLLALLVTSIAILLGFCMLGCTFNEEERRKRRCCADCCETHGDIPICYCYCYDPCPEYRCNSPAGSNFCQGCQGCAGCGGGGGGGGKGGSMDLGEGFIILIIIIIIIVILSAIVVVILYAVQKWSLVYDRTTHMLMKQAEEMEGETVVLAINESWRPVSAV